MTAVGLPHSGTPGSTPARGSPGRIVVRHALHRLSAPRHPPVALCSLIAQRLFFWNGAPADPAIFPAPPEGGTERTPGPTRAPSALVYTCKAYPSSCLQFSRCPIAETSRSPVIDQCPDLQLCGEPFALCLHTTAVVRMVSLAQSLSEVKRFPGSNEKPGGG